MVKLAALPTAEQALPGRAQPIPTAAVHFVNGHALKPPFPNGLEDAAFGLGCFWGAERKFWQSVRTRFRDTNPRSQPEGIGISLTYIRSMSL